GYAPANFLDIGGAASVETIKNGFKILLDDKNVRIIFINIFGGIVRCDRVAKGILEALEGKILNVPLVIRLAGTNADLAGRLLNQSERNFKVIYSLTEAAEAIHACLKNRG
ncbi:succinate--CoA ligase subunit beta, partial [candidate division KSB1 bacterium]|nr:succinate--CoA ligase subunit beta [candidate division KSB1 bacterium]